MPSQTPLPKPRPHLPDPETLQQTTDLLTWAASHDEAKVRRLGADIGELLTALAGRHADETRLTAVTAEIRELREQLAAREAEATRLSWRLNRAPQAGWRDHDPVVVRAWARGRGLDVPATGRVPAALVAAWLEEVGGGG